MSPWRAPSFAEFGASGARDIVRREPQRDTRSILSLSLEFPEPSDCWVLVGVDDAATPPTISRLLETGGTRAEWRRAGLPVTFDERGEPRPILRAGREYRFERVGEAALDHRRRCGPVQ